EHVVAVNPDRSRAQAIREPMSLLNVARPDGGGQAETGSIAALDHLVDVLERQDVHHRPKDLLTRYLHLVLDAVEHGRLDEVAALADPVAAGQQFRAFLLTRLD